MRTRDIENIAAVMAYIESYVKEDSQAVDCQEEKLDLDQIAAAFHYSKFHLHRMFTRTVGITIHDYIRRRRLTEAARRLVFSDQSVIEIAVSAGYESQQAFAGVFKSMYKKTPMEYRKHQFFYPLQLPLDLNRNPSVSDNMPGEIGYAVREDIPGWMHFSSLVLDWFPCYDQGQHQRWLASCVEEKQAVVMRDGEVIIGAAAFSRPAGRIDFLGVHPQYRCYEIGRELLDFMMDREWRERPVSITTFRKGDPADTGQREAYIRLGFSEAEFLTEFGYPTQRMVLEREERQGVLAGTKSSDINRCTRIF